MSVQLNINGMREFSAKLEDSNSSLSALTREHGQTTKHKKGPRPNYGWGPFVLGLFFLPLGLGPAVHLHFLLIVPLDHGTVAELGAPAELMKQDGAFARMVKLQTESQTWSLR